MGLKVLSALDKAQTQCYHFQAILIAGMGFFTDAYDLFCIPPDSNLLGRLYYDNSLLPSFENSAVNGVALCGTFAGQLFFSWLGDRMVYGITLTLMVASSILSGFSLGSTRKSVLTCLSFFRFWLGFGIGGDYPLSATIMAEYSNTKTGGSFIASVFAIQGLGILAASAVAIIVLAPLKCNMAAAGHGLEDHIDVRGCSRRADILLANESALVGKNAKQVVDDMSRVLVLDIEEDDVDVFETREQQFGLFSMAFVRLHGLHLLGTAFAWFFVDIAFYSNNLFQKDVYKSVDWLEKNYDSPVDEVFHIARAQALIALFLMIPGYLFSILLVDRIGRFKIHLVGFFFMSVFLFALVIPYKRYWHDAKHPYGFWVIYSLTFFFANFWRNTTTFLLGSGPLAMVSLQQLGKARVFAFVL